MKDTVQSPLALGRAYLQIRNYDKALEFLGQAVMAGKSNAAKDLYDLGDHFFQEGDYANAEKAFQMLADRGHGESCLRLGEMCEEGIGRKQDLEAAFGYYSESFNQGVSWGAYKAGLLMLPDALAHEEVRDIALTWFDEAIKAGIYEAYSAVGDLYSSHFVSGNTTSDDHVAFTWYLKGAMQKDPLAMVRAADSLFDGCGTQKDTKRALRLYEEAAALGNSDAASTLGHIYEQGLDVPKEFEKAMDWYLKAFEMETEEAPDEPSDAARSLLMALTGTIHMPLNQKQYKFFERYLKVLREKNYAPAFGISAELSRLMGKMDLFEAYLKQGIALGNDMCRQAWVQHQLEEAIEKFRSLQAIIEDYPIKRKQKKFLSKFITQVRDIEASCKEAGKAGSTIAWEILAYLYLYYGGDMGATKEQFLEAAENGKGGTLFDMDYFMWCYYDGLEKPEEGGLHEENPKKAFTLAQKLARKNNEDFYGILAEYYEQGYGIRKSQKMADRWAAKIPEGPPIFF